MSFAGLVAEPVRLQRVRQRLTWSYSGVIPELYSTYTRVILDVRRIIVAASSQHPRVDPAHAPQKRRCRGWMELESHWICRMPGR